MFCSQCGAATSGPFCSQCGAPQTDVPQSSCTEPSDWSHEVRYEYLLRLPEVCDMISRHAAMAKKSLSGEQVRPPLAATTVATLAFVDKFMWRPHKQANSWFAEAHNHQHNQILKGVLLGGEYHEPLLAAHPCPRHRAGRRHHS